MKLETSIKPRRDGTVKLSGLDGSVTVFTVQDDGAIVGDVTHEGTLVHLLTNRADVFWPADESDYAAAQALLDAQGQDADLRAPGADPDDDDDEVMLPPGADPLVEAKTPPAAIPGRKPRASRKTAEK